QACGGAAAGRTVDATPVSLHEYVSVEVRSEDGSVRRRGRSGVVHDRTPYGGTRPAVATRPCQRGDGERAGSLGTAPARRLVLHALRILAASDTRGGQHPLPGAEPSRR